MRKIIFAVHERELPTWLIGAFSQRCPWRAWVRSKPWGFHRAGLVMEAMRGSIQAG